MTTRHSFPTRLGWLRTGIWLAVAAVCGFRLQDAAPTAWQVAVFGALFSFLWPLIRSNGERKRNENDDSAADPAEIDRFARSVDVAIDLLTLTALIYVTGGFKGPIVPLLLPAAVETFALIDRRAAFKLIGGLTVVNVLNVWAPAIPAQSALRNVLMIASILMSAAIIAAERGALRSNAATRLIGIVPRRTKPPTGMIDRLEGELNEMDGSLQHLKESYRSVVRVSRDQKSLIEHLRVIEEIYAAARLTPDGDSANGFARMLTVLTRSFEAGGAALWLRDGHGDTLVVRAMAGRVAPIIQAEPIQKIADMAPLTLRAACEERLTLASPAGALVQFEMEGGVGGARPTLALPFRAEPAEPTEVGRIIGAVGLCDPRGSSRFAPADVERLQSLMPTFASAVESLREAASMQRRVQETSLLYELSRLVQSASEPRELYEAVVNVVERVVTCENSTLYLLDRSRSRLEQRAARGRPVNLLTHFSFDKGPGVSGWVAGKGRLLSIADLKQEPNLLNVEMIPPGVRSFAAIPLRANGAVIGVLNVSDSRPHAFSAEDVQLLSVLAGQAAITIERSETFRALESLAIVDGLTQLYNRRFLDLRLEEELRRSRRYNSPLTLMLIDLDLFKSVNDRYGHLSGDLVLREFAALLRRSVRDTEIVARFGGEEFAVILTETSASRASVAVERIRSNLSRHAFATSDGQPLKVTISVGLADTEAGAENGPDLVGFADQALYEAKRAGRDCYRLAASRATLAPNGNEVVRSAA